MTATESEPVSNVMDDADIDSETEVALWHDVCAVADVPIDRGVAVLVDGTAIALFRLSSAAKTPGATGVQEWYAVSHIEPESGAPIMARGLVGSTGEEPPVPTVASPLHKQRYDLRTGRCLDDPTLSLTPYAVEVDPDEDGGHARVRIGFGAES